LYAFARLIGASDNTTKRQTARCGLVVLSLARHAKLCVVVRRDVALSMAYKPILQFEHSDNVTSRQQASQQRAVSGAALETGQQDDSATTYRLVLCRIVASEKAITI
jgi:hypothetical protein